MSRCLVFVTRPLPGSFVGRRLFPVVARFARTTGYHPSHLRWLFERVYVPHSFYRPSRLRWVFERVYVPHSFYRPRHLRWLFERVYVPHSSYRPSRLRWVFERVYVPHWLCSCFSYWAVIENLRVNRHRLPNPRNSNRCPRSTRTPAPHRARSAMKATSNAGRTTGTLGRWRRPMRRTSPAISAAVIFAARRAKHGCRARATSSSCARATEKVN